MTPLKALSSEPEIPAQIFRPRAGEPAWLASLREKAWAACEAAPMPDRVQHLWRYSDPARFLPRGDAFAEDRADAGTEWPAALAGELSRGKLSGAAFAVNGRFVRAEISETARKAGVVFTGLREGLEKMPALRERFASAVPASQGKFEALNLASFRGGFLLYVPKNVELAEPFHVYSLLSESGAFVPARLLAMAEEGAALTLVDEYACPEGLAAPVQASVVTELFAADGARLRYAALQSFDGPAEVFVTSRALAGRGARVDMAGAFLGARLCKVDQGLILAGENAESEVAGIVFGRGREHMDYHTLLRHEGRRTRSRLDVKTALRDRARSTYTGLIRIESGAVYSDAYQENRNLLLSPGARAETIPELEIITDEVSCSHGATVSPLDPQQLFYLTCRGLSRAEATRAIVGGFFEATLAKLPENIAGRLRERIAAHMEDL